MRLYFLITLHNSGNFRDGSQVLPVSRHDGLEDLCIQQHDESFNISLNCHSYTGVSCSLVMLEMLRD